MNYLHLGGDVVVRTEDVIGIFDLDNTTASLHTRKYLTRVQKADAVVSATEDIPRSVVLCSEDGREKVYLSLLSPAALGRRWEEEAWK